jgi:cell division protein FtsW (lipid II flippase)
MTFARQWQQLAIAANWPVLAAVAFLSAVGVVTLHADRVRGGSDDAGKQLVYMVVGVGCMAGFQAANYQKLGRVAWPIYVISLVLVLYTATGARVSLPLVPVRNGAYHWIVIPKVGFSFQPAELLKVGFIMVMARYLRFRTSYRRLSGLVVPFVLALVPVGLIILQPDLGTALTFIPTLFAMLFVAGARVTHLLVIVLVALLLAPVIWLSGTDRPVFRHLPSIVHTYQRERITGMFSSDQQTLRSSGFQQHLALIAFGSGGIVGKGPGHVPVGANVPEADNDMVFCLVGEQFGFVGAALVVVAYLVLFVAGIEISAATREPFGRLVAVGVVSMLAGQTFLNLGVTMKLLPVTGVTLPFISAGGSSLIASFIAAGLLLNIGQNRPLVIANDPFEFA